jgi:toxin FitB
LPTRSDLPVADLLLDTSAAIALIAPASDAHEAVHERTRGLRLGLAGHAAFETFSVLTRLPGEQRLSPAAAGRVLATNFPSSAYLDADAAASALVTLARAGIAGGAVYDGLVALAARAAGLPLLSCDRRARHTYAVLEVDVALV